MYCIKERIIGYNQLVPTLVLLFTLTVSLLSASFIAALSEKSEIGSNTDVPPKQYLLDPNPKLIDKQGNLIQNVTLASNLIPIRNGDWY